MLLNTAFDAGERVTAEFTATRFAVDHALTVCGSDARLTLAAGRAGVTDGQLARAAAVVEVTFCLRLFVHFEAVLRDYWATGLGRTTRPDMRPLMDSIARRRRMNNDDLAGAHAVRDYRNAVAHGGAGTPPVRLADCQRGLGRYLRRLPQRW